LDAFCGQILTIISFQVKSFHPTYVRQSARMLWYKGKDARDLFGGFYYYQRFPADESLVRYMAQASLEVGPLVALENLTIDAKIARRESETAGVGVPAPVRD
jgi:hypothetical protein